MTLKFVLRSAILSFFFLLSSTDANAWAKHHLITAEALQSIPELHTKQVKTTSFQSLVESLGLSSPVAFNEALKLRKSYVFKDESQTSMPLAEILAKYSDEPDWDMDLELFDDNQYPELWRPEYEMMGGKKGLGSDAFRHLYWPPFSISVPLASAKLPLSKFFQPMGTTPDRALIFWELSQKAKQRGHEYWAARFLACALHYLEDAYNPFHSTQTPTKFFLLVPLQQEGLKGMTDYVSKVDSVITDTHLAFEDAVSKNLGRLKDSLHQGGISESYSIESRVKRAAFFSSRFAESTARHWYFKKEIDESIVENLTPIFCEMGRDIRSVVREE